MATLPVRPITPPAVLAGQTNGKLPGSILVDVPCLYGGPTVRLVEPPARAWIALRGVAAKAGHKLKCSGTYDSYRPYEQQLKVFLARYTPVSYQTPVYWDGRYWVKKDPNFATAAKPGFSNHGKGLAIDTGEETDGDTGTESLDAATLNWLAANALDFGWSWELVPEEPWHLHYFPGDAIPAAVLAYEGDDMGIYCKHGDTGDAVWRLETRLEGLGYQAYGSANGRFDDPTAAALKAAMAEAGWPVDGRTYNRGEDWQLDALIARKLGAGPGPKGEDGDKGDPGPPGDAAVLAPGTTLIVSGE